MVVDVNRSIGEGAIRRFFFMQIIGVSLFNSIINFSYTWWLWIDHSVVHMFDGVKVGYDLAGTPAVIAFLSTSLGTGSARKFFGKHREAISQIELSSVWLRVPSNLMLRTIVATILAMVFFSLPLFGLLSITAPQQLQPLEGCAAKVILTLIFSVIIVPCVLKAALADARRTL